MEKGLLSVSTENAINIGDYIQAIAAKQFINQVDEFVERERLDKYTKGNIKIIMNGWFMHHPENWPPSKKIHPLFVSFHINSVSYRELLSIDSCNYLRKFQPIGCRDKITRDLLIKKNIDAYFSGCLTLTLGFKYKSKTKKNKSYIVDPYYLVNKDTVSLLRYLFFMLFHFILINKLNKKMNKKFTLRNLLKTSCYYMTYRKVFTKNILVKSEYISQAGQFYKDKIKNNTTRMEFAEELIHKYSEASFVITSRIHCALPCLGLETPVLYIENKQQEKTSKCRLKGLAELLNIIPCDNGKLTNPFSKKKLCVSNHPENKEQWKILASQLIKKCTAFANQK